jgi:hypothetical protein
VAANFRAVSPAETENGKSPSTASRRIFSAPPHFKPLRTAIHWVDKGTQAHPQPPALCTVDSEGPISAHPHPAENGKRKIRPHEADAKIFSTA